MEEVGKDGRACLLHSGRYRAKQLLVCNGVGRRARSCWGSGEGQQSWGSSWRMELALQGAPPFSACVCFVPRVALLRWRECAKRGRLSVFSLSLGARADLVLEQPWRLLTLSLSRSHTHAHRTPRLLALTSSRQREI